MRTKFAVLFGLMSLVVCLSCSNDDNPAIEVPTPFPHTLAPVGSMQIDFSDLSGGAKEQSGLCHALSSLVVSWVNVNVMVRLALPVIAVASCFDNDPEYVAPMRWEWTATGGSGANAWTAKLSGFVTGADSVHWAMRISGTPLHFTDYLWFDGFANYIAAEGSWDYYDPESPELPRRILTSNWSLPAGTEDKTIDFINVDESDDGFEDRLAYQIQDDEASVSFFDASVPGTTTVEWNLDTGEGSTTSVDGSSCCWGQRPAFPDIECP